jgi:cytochrome c oxidase cbb3-type subunit 3
MTLTVAAILVLAVLLAAPAQQPVQQAQPTHASQMASRTPVQQQMGPLPGPGPDTLNEATNPYAADAAAIREGRRLFGWYNCAGCHGDHGGGGMGPSLRDSTWIYGGTDMRIFSSIAAGRTKGMPSWGPKLPPEQIWKLVAYIRTLGTSKEPDKP